MKKFRKNQAKDFLVKKLLKINKRPAPNKDVLGGKSLENNKNVLDYYLADQSTVVEVVVANTK